ncbi:MAG: UDP-N-acetylmuramate:L-alanyl-gamma-D-glutamyl-meso-diaminopimelate ligase [Gammaproteobacteria bacterium]
MGEIYILGIAGTFMAGLAKLGQELGYKVSGADRALYAPMSDQLAALGIPVDLDWANIKSIKHLASSKENREIILGNIMSRGMPVVEDLLAERVPFYSGPQWLYEKVLRHRKVLAVAGTHGKTTTASMLAWVLSDLGLKPGFLIGGLPSNFESSACLGEGEYFVLEADEYDSAFFDKRPKFLHYWPQHLILNNLEYDHADIYPDLKAIQKQVHYLLRLLPQNGVLVAPNQSSIQEVLAQGFWSEQEQILEPEHWHYEVINTEQSMADIYQANKCWGRLSWELKGKHNFNNALAVIALCSRLGLDLGSVIQSLKRFKGVKRRLELKPNTQDVFFYEDFGHHPTAIAYNLDSLKANLKPNARLHAIVDLASNTMKLGVHAQTLPKSLELADAVYFYSSQSNLNWDVEAAFKICKRPGGVFNNKEALLEELKNHIKAKDTLILFSNGALTNIQI